MRDLARSRIGYGYRRLQVLLLREGWRVNHKLVYLLYREEGLCLRAKKCKKRKMASVARIEPVAATRPLERWSMDFLSDRLADGRRYRVLTLVDHVSKVSPAVQVGFSISADQVVEVLDRLARSGQKPQSICIDNGPEFAGKALDAWAWLNGVQLIFSRPGKPTDNAMIEAFNARMRAECLNASWFVTIAEAQIGIEAWRQEYNEQRPHSALGLMTPNEHLMISHPAQPLDCATAA